MISYFPVLYKDELLYSLLCRLWTHSGYCAYSYFAINTFIHPTERINIEFINQLQPQIIESLISNKNMDDIVRNNTMYPQYTHFIPFEKRNTVFLSLLNNNDDYKSALIMDAAGKQRFLKYCPICSANDRKNHGETFWHRSHQLNNIKYCYIHNVELISTNVSLSAKTSPILHPAELVIPTSSHILYCDNPKEVEFTKYITAVHNASITNDTTEEIGPYLHSQLFGSKYVSTRGEQRNISLLYKDILEFYDNTYLFEFLSASRLQKIFTSYRHNYLEICMIAYFLNVSPHNLVNRINLKKDQVKKFDNTVLLLHKEGLGCNKIAKKLGVSSRTVRDIVYPKEKKSSSPITYTCGPAKKDWQTIDQQTLSLVKEAIQQIQSSYRPQKVNVFSVTKILKLPDKTLYSLPLCINEINKHKENSHEYWTRELLWAYQDTLKNNEKLQWTSLRKRTNLRRCNALACIPILEEKGSEDAKELIKIIKE